MSRRSFWSPWEDKTIIDRRAAGDKPAVIGKAVARTEASVCSRLRYHGANTVAGAKRVVEQGSYSKPKDGNGRGGKDIDPALCPSIVAARDQYNDLLDQRDLTARICGDPAPGRAAFLAELEAKAGAL